MKPVIVSTEVAAPPAQVFEHLDTLANHEAFLDHYLEKWKFSGPASGVGAKAEALAKAPGSQDWFEFEVVECEAPRLLVEDAVSSGGKRRTRGTYRLSEAGGGTRIEFELGFLELPRSERIAPFLTRAFAKRVNAKAMRRLAKQLDG
ncbi:MAG TPA: SRPBCC family protein [Solirubrobacterales bacterium]|nr:SRPBCC family protein [Solirubrobacterales bacterium]